MKQTKVHEQFEYFPCFPSHLANMLVCSEREKVAYTQLYLEASHFILFVRGALRTSPLRNSVNDGDNAALVLLNS